jgi:hypothetical protein
MVWEELEEIFDSLNESVTKVFVGVGELNSNFNWHKIGTKVAQNWHKIDTVRDKPNHNSCVEPCCRFMH